MSSNVAVEKRELVDEIVQRVLLRLQGNSLQGNNDVVATGLNNTHASSGAEYSGRLLTVASLENLSLGKQLRVSRKCVVTPEVADQLKQRGVELLRGDLRVSDRSVPQSPTGYRLVAHEESPLMCWEWTERTGVSQRSKSCLDTVAGSQAVRVFSCDKQLIDALIQGDGKGQKLHVIAGYQALRLQQELNQRGQFAPLVDPASSESIEEVLQARPRIVLVRTPVANWGLKRFVNAWRSVMEQRNEK